MNFLLIFFSGFTLAVAGINLFIGISNTKDKSYLYFGLLSFFASLFLLTGIGNSPSDLMDVLGIFTAVMFYGLFIWFIGEYTGYKFVLAQWITTAFVLVVFISYFLVGASVIAWELWEFIAHFTIVCISIYGLVAGWKGLRGYNVFWKSIYMIFMLILFLSALVIGLESSFGIGYDIGSVGGVTILDFFPVFFSLIVGSKMSHEVLKSMQLEDEVKQKDREWSTLMDSINLLVVKLDLRGKITYINSHLINFTGYTSKDLLGKDWFELLLDPQEKTMEKESFLSLLHGDGMPLYQYHIKTRNGSLKSIQWSNLTLYDNAGIVTGALSIGTDVTERESALEEIQLLKDQLEKENLWLKAEVKKSDYSSEIIGESDALMYVIKRAHQVASTNSSVLLEGETGVGKELFANMIHQNSTRRHKSFIKVNCASLPKELIESELFGHEKGSFTGALKTRKGRFELADKGTIFLDEIGELPLDLQPKLLRVLQSGEFERIGSEQTKKVDVRVIAATNRNLQEESERGVFRQDLFFRLNVYPITIPPLRQRREDIPILIKHFTSSIGRKIGRKIKHISKADIIKLQAFDWPGNVRELENVLERAIISSEGDTMRLDESQLKPSFQPAANTGSQQSQDLKDDAEVATLLDSQKKHIVNVLNECNWKINGGDGAASKLGMPPSTLRSKMKKLNIERPKTK